ncbi:MAG: hypothetical protein V5A88_06455 [Candidatus Thermoplasmatota archaeon]
MDGKRVKEMFDRSSMISIILVLLVAVVLLVPNTASPTLVSAEENDEEVKVPEWYEGDSWEYKVKEKLAEGMTLLTEVEKEVIGEKKYKINIVEGGTETYESYVLEERHDREVEEEDKELEDIKGEFGYTKDKLSPITTQPTGQNLSVYYPPLKELDFPFSVGDNWSYDEGYFLEKQSEDDPLEPARNIIKYQGRVEEKVTRDVNGKSLETYMVNFTILAEDLNADENPLRWRRQEIYFSPEVKNVVHKEMYETRRLPEEDYGDEAIAREENVGNETLVDYDVQPYEPENEDGEESLLGVGIILLIIGITTATLYFYKKVKTTH